MNKLYLSREIPQSTKFNIKTVLQEAIKNNNTLRLDNKNIHTWFSSIPESTKKFLLNTCKEKDIQVLM